MSDSAESALATVEQPCAEPEDAVQPSWKSTFLGDIHRAFSGIHSLSDCAMTNGQDLRLVRELPECNARIDVRISVEADRVRSVMTCRVGDVTECSSDGTLTTNGRMPFTADITREVSGTLSQWTDRLRRRNGTA